MEEVVLQQDAQNRVNTEIKKIEAFRRTGKLRKNWNYLGPHIDGSGYPVYTLFDFSWKAEEGYLEGGVYNAQFKISGNLSTVPPKAVMLDKFTHMHVYGHGDVCFPFVDRTAWKSNTSLIDVAQELEDMLNLEPDIKSPAHLAMKELYIKSPEEYFQFLRTQAKNFENNKPINKFS